MGKPLYGDVFGITGEDATNVVEEDTVDKTPWGELESESESEEESEDEDEDEDQTGLVTPGDALVLFYYNVLIEIIQMLTVFYIITPDSVIVISP